MTRLLASAADGIAKLNRRYGPAVDDEPRFFLFHRRRQWSRSAAQVDGLGAQARQAARVQPAAARRAGHFVPASWRRAGRRSARASRYVITLDADTRLPIGAVGQLVGTAAHPLNGPRLDAGGRRVVEGYAHPAAARHAEAAGAHGELGVPAPVLRAFGRRPVRRRGVGRLPGSVRRRQLHRQGSVRRRRIRRLSKRAALPENAVLSHDLFEGAFARCALVSDIELFEDFPYHAEVATARTHRWTRGDWQLLPWIFGHGGRGIRAISRWKMLDNLRRSLLAPAALATLVASWSIPHAPADRLARSPSWPL